MSGNLPDCGVAVVGAGPYGLSAVAHLRAIKGFDSRIFGRPMSFWKQHMPRGMFLRSPLEGSNLSDPAGKLTLQAYAQTNGGHLSSPLPLERFVDYGCWFQQQMASDIDGRAVSCIEHDGTYFRLTIEDGEKITSARVVVAGGIVPFAYRPPQFQGLPSELASHSCEHRDLRVLAGKRVMVVGGGQSALESAALLHEAGADVRVVIRETEIHWTWQTPWLHTFKPVSRVLYAPPDVGPAGISHVVAAPGWFRHLPRRLQNRWAGRSVRPAGAGWLKPRLQCVTMSTGRSVLCAAAVGDKLRVRLDDGNEESIDHLLMATGYKIDITKYDFLSQGLLARVNTASGYPILSKGFESSLPGLHFLGAPAAWSFGPLMRFVAGADFATRRLAHYVSTRRPFRPV